MSDPPVFHHHRTYPSSSFYCIRKVQSRRKFDALPQQTVQNAKAIVVYMLTGSNKSPKHNSRNISLTKLHVRLRAWVTQPLRQTLRVTPSLSFVTITMALISQNAAAAPPLNAWDKPTSEVRIVSTYKLASFSYQQLAASSQAHPATPHVTDDDTASVQVTTLRVEGLGNSNNSVLKDSYLSDIPKHTSLR